MVHAKYKATDPFPKIMLEERRFAGRSHGREAKF